MERSPPVLRLFFSSRRQTLVHQVQRDNNIRTLLAAIRDTFEFEKTDILRDIQPGSMKAKIFNEMLQCVSESAEFIESYAKDVRVGTSY
jgi:hypothetical protein